MAKKRFKMAKKEKPKSGRWVLPAVIIVFIVLLAVVLWFLFPVKIAKDFGQAVSFADEIDKAHNISFSDYSRGIYYLISNPRYPNPLNPDEIETLTREYGMVYGSESVKLFTGFRINLANAEKYYKLSGKTYKANLHDYGINCKSRDAVVESIENLNKSIQNLNIAINNIAELEQKYPSEFGILNISQDWINLINASGEDFQAEIEYKITEWNKFCNNTI